MIANVAIQLSVDGAPDPTHAASPSLTVIRLWAIVRWGLIVPAVSGMVSLPRGPERITHHSEKARLWCSYRRQTGRLILGNAVHENTQVEPVGAARDNGTLADVQHPGIGFIPGDNSHAFNNRFLNGKGLYQQLSA